MAFHLLLSGNIDIVIKTAILICFYFRKVIGTFSLLLSFKLVYELCLRITKLYYFLVGDGDQRPVKVTGDVGTQRNLQDDLTHICQMDFPIIIIWMSPLSILGESGVFFHFL